MHNHNDRAGALRERIVSLTSDLENIQARADAESRDFTADEQAELASILAAIDETKKNLDLRASIVASANAANAPLGRKSVPADPANAADGTRRAPAQPRDPRNGFRNLGEFANSVYKASAPGAMVDSRLMANAPTTYGSEGVGADGGFAVPPEFRTAILEKITGQDSLFGRVDKIDVTGNSLTFPKDEAAPWHSKGVAAYWENEAAQLTASKVALGEDSLRLNKLTALVPVTNELLEDAPAMNSYINRKAPEKIKFKLDEAILTGTGVGKPLGILNSPALVTVAKDPLQGTPTVITENIANMWAAMYAPARANAVWLINPEVEASLLTMVFMGSAAAIPTYLPPGGLSTSPYSTLMGRPVIHSPICSALGTKGDILFVDPTAYLVLQKIGGLRAEMSIHLYFDYDLTAFRFILRVGGKPWFDETIAPLNGTLHQSHYVALATRP